LEPFVQCDGLNCIGIVLVPLDKSGKELEPVGVAHFLREGPEADSGEAAVAVADAWQGRGVGSLLIKALAKECRTTGVRRIWGLMLAENAAARKLLASVGTIEAEAARGGRVELMVVLDEPDAEQPTCIDSRPERE
jgi:GNAT superfamily N-acetyltransferase